MTPTVEANFAFTTPEHQKFDRLIFALKSSSLKN